MKPVEKRFALHGILAPPTEFITMVVAKFYKKCFALYRIWAPPTGFITRWTSKKNQILILIVCSPLLSLSSRESHINSGQKLLPDFILGYTLQQPQPIWSRISGVYGTVSIGSSLCSVTDGRHYYSITVYYFSSICCNVIIHYPNILTGHF